MKTIYKYPITSTNCVIFLPAHAKIISAAPQGSQHVIWAVVDTDAAFSQERRIRVFMTGQDMGPLAHRMEHIATYQVGPIVYHIFEELA